MRMAVTARSGREHVLTATGHHPYACLHTGGGDEVRAYLADRAAVWLTAGSTGPTWHALGAAEPAVRLLVGLAGHGELAGVRRVHLPRIERAALAGYLPVREPDDWDFRWTTRAPSPQPGEHRVVRLAPGDAPLIEELLDRAFPASFSRPGSPRVRGWFGIRDGDRLVACCADRSHGGVGSIAAVAVCPDTQGRGLGGALTAAAARTLLGEFETVTLGVMADNERAARLYRRLGFTRSTGRTSADLAH